MLRTISSMALAALILSAATPAVAASRNRLDLAVVMTNDADENQIEVYDAHAGTLLQRLPTHGKGGASANARGVRQLDGDLVAVVNHGSNTVALYQRDGDRLHFDRLVTTTSAPVSIDFANGHMYVAGSTTVDSFVMHGREVGWLDGTATLQLAGGGEPPEGSTAQVGIVDRNHALVTLKGPDPGTVDVLTLRDGAVTADDPAAIPAPDGSLTPFGFVVNPDGTALITLAHSDDNALFRDGAFAAVTAAGQGAPCWMTRVGKYVFVANTGSKSVSRLVGTGSHVFVDAEVAASTPTGAPADVDAAGGVLAVVDHGSGQAHLSLFAYDDFGDLVSAAAPITLGGAGANGVAILTR